MDFSSRSSTVHLSKTTPSSSRLLIFYSKEFHFFRAKIHYLTYLTHYEAHHSSLLNPHSHNPHPRLSSCLWQHRRRPRRRRLGLERLRRRQRRHSLQQRHGRTLRPRQPLLDGMSSRLRVCIHQGRADGVVCEPVERVLLDPEQ